MKKLIFITLLEILIFLLGISINAPVPKHLQKDPIKLTPQLLEGSWQYEWSSMLNGWIVFDKDGTYTAQHYPEGTTTYSGTYSVGENSITIVEWGFDSSTGRSWGPSCYRFDIDFKAWPKLPGKSTSGFGFDIQQIPEATTHLKLSKVKNER